MEYSRSVVSNHGLTPGARRGFTRSAALHNDGESYEDPEIQNLAAMIAELRLNLKNAQNDVENMKIITNRDVTKARDFGIEKAMKQLINVSDTLEICLQNKPNFETEPHKHNAVALAGFKGLESIRSELAAVFTSYEIDRIETKVGDPFDPTLHNALFQMPPASANVASDTIGVVIKTGWKRKDQLLRASDVGVVKK